MWSRILYPYLYLIMYKLINKNRVIFLVEFIWENIPFVSGSFRSLNSQNTILSTFIYLIYVICVLFLFLLSIKFN